MELLRNLKFLKIKQPDKKSGMVDFRDQWKLISAELPQGEPDISQDEIMSEIRVVRGNKASRQNAG